MGVCAHILNQHLINNFNRYDYATVDLLLVTGNEFILLLDIQR